MISLDTKAYYYEKLFKIMVTPPKLDDEIHGVYSPGTVKVTTYKGRPFIYLIWDILHGKMQYHLGVVPGNHNEIMLFAELHFKKTPLVEVWVKQKRNSEISDKGDHYEWKVQASDAADYFNDVRLQTKNCEIPSEVLNMAAFTVKNKFLTFCSRGGFDNPYFDLYRMLQ